mmetsp:Transcript_7308/g.16844  ORF Transcript_7308/g.16844 Transcript_7308/m.16844 type:complete len:616 (-) Transcript_7308:322-2169(-)
MYRCVCARPRTALENYAKSLRQLCDDDCEADPMPHPMYVVPMDAVLQMTELKPHEELLAEGVVIEFEAGYGKAAFLSHQWISSHHPDPHLEQMRVFQEAVVHMKTGLKNIPLDVFTDTQRPFEKGPSTAKMFSKPIFVWYDFFCCPQADACQLSKAIESIPAYIARCSLFFVLCPVIQQHGSSEVLGPRTWAERGWCRAERTFRELSMQNSWIAIKSSKNVEVMSTSVASYGGSVGEGMFSQMEDLAKLSPVLGQRFRRKLMAYLRDRDFVSYRVLYNLHNFHMRGLPVEEVFDLPGSAFEEFSSEGSDHSLEAQVVARFLHQNGLRHIRQVDEGGWTPLCYAAMNGDPVLVRGLLQQRANPNDQTRKQQKMVGLFPRISALALCAFFRNHEAMRLLIDAGASISAGWEPPMCTAAWANCPTGIRILCEAGGRALVPDVLGLPALQHATGFGSVDAFQEIVAQASDAADLSYALHWAMLFRGGSAHMVGALVEAKADLNEQLKLSPRTAMGALCKLLGLLHRQGESTHMRRFAYHANGATPLMIAVIAGQYEGAAALIRAGAEVGLQNDRGALPVDMARELAAPSFLIRALEEGTRPCRLAEIASEEEEMVVEYF